MIIKLQPTEIEKYWEVIKFASCKADDIKDKDISNYSINLLYKLLNEEFFCYLIFDDNRKIRNVMILSHVHDSISDEKGLYFNCLYGFQAGFEELIQKDGLNFYNSLKSSGYKFITTSIRNPSLMKLVEKYNFNKISTNYRYDL